MSKAPAVGHYYFNRSPSTGSAAKIRLSLWSFLYPEEILFIGAPGSNCQGPLTVHTSPDQNKHSWVQKTALLGQINHDVELKYCSGAATTNYIDFDSSSNDFSYHRWIWHKAHALFFQFPLIKNEYFLSLQRQHRFYRFWMWSIKTADYFGGKPVSCQEATHGLLFFFPGIREKIRENRMSLHNSRLFFL